MHAKLCRDGIPARANDLPGDWPDAPSALNAARQVYEMRQEDGYCGFAFAGNDAEKWAVMLLWSGDDREHPYTLKVWEGREPGFDADRLRVGM